MIMQGINITPSPKKTTPKKSTPLSTRSSASSSAPIPNVAPPVPPPDIPTPEPTPAPKPKATPKPKIKPVPPPVPPEPVKQVGVELINNNTRSFWKGQNVATLKLQCELRGKRFTDAETKGTTKFINGNNLKVKGMKKQDYLLALCKLLKI